MPSVAAIFITFVAALIIGLVIFSCFDLIKPNFSPKTYSFYNAFPTIAPKDLPDPILSSEANTAHSCSPGSSDSECSVYGSNFTCTTIGPNDPTHVYNNIKLTSGSWCLPKKEEEAYCNPFTGRWTWSSDSSGQTWKCECLYPSLFDNPDEGCEEQVACKNNSSKVSGYKQTSLLKATSAAPPEFQGQYWNPLNIDPTNTDILRQNPLGRDSSGNPLFSCECNPIAVDNQSSAYYTTTLPGDPFSCHLDPCVKNINGGEYNRKLIQLQPDGTYTCDCSDSGVMKLPTDSLSDPGTCALISDICNGGTWDDNSQQCGCQTPGNPPPPAGLFVNCDSENPCPQNPLGKTCIFPCANAQCNDGSCIADASQPGNYKCQCPDAGTNSLGGKLQYKEGSECLVKCTMDNEYYREDISSGDISPDITYANYSCCNGRTDGGNYDTLSTFPSTDIKYKC